MKAINHSARFTMATLLAVLLAGYLFANNVRAAGQDVWPVTGPARVQAG